MITVQNFKDVQILRHSIVNLGTFDIHCSPHCLTLFCEKYVFLEVALQNTLNFLSQKGFSITHLTVCGFKRNEAK